MQMHMYMHMHTQVHVNMHTHTYAYEMMVGASPVDQCLLRHGQSWPGFAFPGNDRAKQVPALAMDAHARTG